jgi:hypothetical protein
VSPRAPALVDALLLVEMPLRSNDATIYTMALQTCGASHIAEQRGGAAWPITASGAPRIDV